jgi:hypothetical protein
VLANVAFLLEFVERGSYGGSADVQPFGEVAFDDPGSGREFAVHDEFTKLLEGCVDAGSVDESGLGGLFEVGGGLSGKRIVRSGHRGISRVKREVTWIVRSQLQHRQICGNDIMKVRNCIQ